MYNFRLLYIVLFAGNNFQPAEYLNSKDTPLEHSLEKRIKSSSNIAKDNRRFVICETSDDTDRPLYSIRKVDNDLVNRLTQIKDYGQDLSTTANLIDKGGELATETKMLISPETIDNKKTVIGTTERQSYDLSLIHI